MGGVFQNLLLVFIFLFGLIVGSFLNCLIYRLETGESFLKGRSFCPYCKHVLSWQELIPIFSFLILKGKCRYCRRKISLQYPLVEVATGILFLLPFSPSLSYLLDGRLIFKLDLLFYWLISSFFIVIFVYDLKHYLIPDKIIYPAIASAFLYRLFGALDSNLPTILPAFGWAPFRIWDLFRRPPNFFGAVEFRIFETLGNPFVSAFLVSAFFLIIVLVSRGRWMGAGDIKLAFCIGLFLGWPKILVALFLAFLIGATIGIGLIIFGKKTLKSEIPFGPFLVLGTFLAMFFGEKIFNYYLSFFWL